MARDRARDREEKERERATVTTRAHCAEVRTSVKSWKEERGKRKREEKKEVHVLNERSSWYGCQGHFLYTLKAAIISRVDCDWQLPPSILQPKQCLCEGFRPSLRWIEGVNNGGCRGHELVDGENPAGN